MKSQARNEVETEIRDLELKVYELKQKAFELRRNLPKDEVQNYELTQTNGEKITLLDLFGKNEELFLIHNMGPGCPYCTLWADGLNGFTPYLNERCAFWLESDIAPDDLKNFSKKRGWNFNVVSSVNTSLKLDFGFQESKNNHPGYSTFYKEDGKIFRHATGPFGPGDEFCSIWSIINRLKNEQNDWQPKFNQL